MSTGVSQAPIAVPSCLILPLFSSRRYSSALAVANGTVEDYAICDWIENAFVLEVIPPNWFTACCASLARCK